MRNATEWEFFGAAADGQSFQIGGSEKGVITFAAGEFSNCMWGFYVREHTE